MSMTVVTIVGARPQFVKAAVVSRALRATAAVSEVLVHTGQHYDESMSDVFFSQLGIAPPAYNLGIGSLSHGAQTGRMLEGIEGILLETTPDWVVVYGDTNSTLAGALAAAKLHIPVAHVEAGLRSFNQAMPEEVNRLLTDHLSTVLFTPTEAAVDNLLAEGISPERVLQVGDVMYDAALLYGAQAMDVPSPIAQRGITGRDYALATIHRAENTDSPRRLKVIANALRRLADERPVVMPLHPRTRSVLDREGLLAGVEQDCVLLEPVSYLEMVRLEKEAAVIITDSGGVQKEAFFQRVPCVTVRNETEWVELVRHGVNRLAPPTDETVILEKVHEALRDGIPHVGGELYGGGRASFRIAERLTQGP